MSSLVMLLLATMLATADALQCYVCANTECSFTMTCPPPHDRCLKAVQTTGAVVRSCGLKAVCDAQVPGIKTYCCEKDLCNGAGTVGKNGDKTVQLNGTGTVGKNLLLLLVPLASIFVLS